MWSKYKGKSTSKKCNIISVSDPSRFLKLYLEIMYSEEDLYGNTEGH